MISETETAFDRVVNLAQRDLGFDAVVLAERTADGELYRAVAGDAAAFDVSPGLHPVSGASYSQPLLRGRIAGVVADLPAADSLGDLPLYFRDRVGSYVAVPLLLSDGTLYGSMWGLNRTPNPELAARDTRFLAMVAKLLIPELEQQRADQRLRAEILALVERETLNVAYQPIIDLRTGACLGLEALARFPEPYHRPDRAFALAERYGLGLALEELVVRQAWRMLPQLARGQFLALNLTPGSLLALARRANRRQELPLSSLVIEVTEHTAIKAYDDLREELTRLRARGLRIAVDDAGAGYASLRHVLELRPDIIKIDRSLIDGLAEDRARGLVVGSFVSLARDLRAQVVAEGIEQEADLRAARHLGITAGQGYLLGRPSTDPADHARWLSQTPRYTGAQRPSWTPFAADSPAVLRPVVPKAKLRL